MKKFFIIIAGTALMSCSSKPDPKEMGLLNTAKDTQQVVSISRPILDQMIQTLPSPIETANIIKKSTGEFKKELLIPSENADLYTDKFSQALAFGGFGVNLGYINLNEKTLYVLEYLGNARTIAKELQVEQFFDFKVLSNMAKNSNNVDSLIHISTQNFNQIDEHLRQQNRGDLSVLILIGSWIEGMYMFSEMAKTNPNEELRKRIGEQKVIINNIYAILNKIEFIQYYKDFKQKLNPLKSVYDKVNITYIYMEPEMKEVNGELVVVDKTETKIEMTDQQLKDIMREITDLRNKTFIKNRS